MLSNLAKFHLSLSYGDKDRCIEELSKVIEKYKNCKNINSKNVLERIKHYESVIYLINQLRNNDRLRKN